MNTMAAFLILICCSFINWDYQITRYNLSTADYSDMEYLINLSDQNAILLKEQNYSVIESSHKEKIEKKYEDYLAKIENQHWQELTYPSIRLETTYTVK